MAAERRVYVCGMPGGTAKERSACYKPCPADSVDPITQDAVGDDAVRMVVNGSYRCYDRDGLVRWLGQDDGRLPDVRAPLSDEQLAHLGVYGVRRQRVADYYLDDVPARPSFDELRRRQEQIDDFRAQICMFYEAGTEDRDRDILAEFDTAVEALVGLQLDALQNEPARRREYVEQNRNNEASHRAEIRAILARRHAAADARWRAAGRSRENAIELLSDSD